MKPRVLLTLLSLLLIAAPGLRAEERGPEKHTELGDKMEKANAAWRKLRRDLSDPAKNADSLAQVAAMKSALLGADKLQPEKEADLPAADRARFQADFAASMKKLGETFDRLEAALKANDNEQAGRIYKELGELQKEAHHAFRRPPPERKGPPPQPKG